MKNCTINFGVGYITVSEEELYGREGERPLSPIDILSRILQVINNHKSEWKLIKDSIILNLKDNSAISNTVTFKQLKGKDGLVPNVNFKYVQELYPEIEFPDIDVPILLLDNLDIQSSYPVMGRILDKNGKEIFVVRSDKDSLVKLGDYLKIRDKVIKQEYKNSLEEADLRDLEELASKENTTVNELLLQFLNNKKEIKEKSKSIVNGRSAYVILEDVSRIIKDVPQKIKYKNPILNEFNYRIKGTKDGNFKISIKELAKLLNARFPKLFPALKTLKELFTKGGKKVIEELSKVLNLSELEKEFLDLMTSILLDNTAEEDSDMFGMNLLFETINSLVTEEENPLSLEVAGVEGDSLLLEKQFPSLESLYGFNYDTIASFTKEETRNGYNIYSYTKEDKDRTITYYYVSKWLINEDSLALRFNSLELAQEWIDSHYLLLKIKKNSLYDLKLEWNGGIIDPRVGRTFKSLVYIPEGTVITSIDMPIDIRSTSMLEDEYYLLDKSLLDFYNYIDTFPVTENTKSEIRAKINTPEKALLYLSEINRLLNIQAEDGSKSYPRNDETRLLNIANSIAGKELSYYYISKSYGVEGGYRTHFIQTDERATTTNRGEKRYPIIQLLDSIAATMQNKFGVPVHIIGQEELDSMDMDLNTVKAFIRNGEIYINRMIANGLDAFHEYAHLFLGALKANPEYRLNYLDFIDKVLSTEEGLEALLRKQKRFPNVPMIDLAEEVVADLYGSYMLNNLPYELTTLFKENEDIKKIQDTIFNRKDRKKTVLEFNGSLKYIWQHFNSEVARTLSDNISFIKDGSIQVLRKKANWISKKINDKEIIERCNP